MADRRIFADATALTEGAAAFIVEEAERAIAARGMFSFVLSGGGTPKPVYERLAQPPFAARVDWTRTKIFFGDERCVAPDDPRSNAHMAREALLAHVPIPAENIFPMQGDLLPEKAALDYERTLVTAVPDGAFDLVLLGMGDNGHTASIFPGLPAITETTRRVLAQYVEVAGMWRLTLTPPAINRARHVAFLVSGAGKAEMSARILEGPEDPIVLPAQTIRPAGALTWLLDRPAAAKLRAS